MLRVGAGGEPRLTRPSRAQGTPRPAPRTSHHPERQQRKRKENGVHDPEEHRQHDLLNRDLE